MLSKPCWGTIPNIESRKHSCKEYMIYACIVNDSKFHNVWQRPFFWWFVIRDSGRLSDLIFFRLSFFWYAATQDFESENVSSQAGLSWIPRIMMQVWGRPLQPSSNRTPIYLSNKEKNEWKNISSIISIVIPINIQIFSSKKLLDVLISFS